VPHFTFQLDDGQGHREPLSGITLPDAEAAWYHAYRSARELLCQKIGHAEGWQRHTLEVEDELGELVWSVPMAEMVELAS
jgi:hypothetical protein